ncbi:MAG: lipopolysaccharide assembly protein LapA domain-containing protein [Alphaproteobacteria bacterium]
MRYLFWLVALPVGVVVIAFAVANRGPVVISFAPLPFAVELSVFAVVLGAFVIGFGAGGAAAWLSAGKVRRLARAQRRRITFLERELKAVRERADETAAGEREAAERLPAAREGG